MKKTEAQLDIAINCECPYCEDDFNLLDPINFEYLNEDGYLYQKALSQDEFGCAEFNEKITCPNCNKEFEVESILW